MAIENALATYAITGVVSGIGAALARVLKRRGHRVIGLDIAEPMENVDRYIPLDHSDTDSIIAASRALDEPLDEICHNAGLPPRDGLAEKILRVNFLDPRRLTAEVMDRIKPNGSIVNIASRAGRGWREGVAPVKDLVDANDKDELGRFVEEQNVDPTRAYNLSKEALIVWTMAETERLIERDLRMNCVSPSAVATGILDEFTRAFGDGVTRNSERAGRAGSPHEIAQVAEFLLSPASGWLKGADILIDGGVSAFTAADYFDLECIRIEKSNNSS